MSIEKVEKVVERIRETARRIAADPYIDYWLYDYAVWLLSLPKEKISEIVALRARICKCYLCKHVKLVGFDATCSLGISEDKCTKFESI